MVAVHAWNSIRHRSAGPIPVRNVPMTSPWGAGDPGDIRNRIVLIAQSRTALVSPKRTASITPEANLPE
jgi:hypothetical protein